MSNAAHQIPEPRQSCKSGSASEWLADFFEYTGDDEFAEDCIHHALNEGVISYEQAYALRTGGGL